MICGFCSETLDAQPATCSNCQQSPLLEGRYRLDEVVGRGALGVTYRATRLDDGLVVAVKELPYRRIDAVKTKTLFEREARVLKQLNHPGIPAYVDDFLGGTGKNLSLYLVQTFVTGETLTAAMDRRRWREDEVLALMARVADILTYLHNLSPPVIHRDIKPANIMQRADGSLALIDFGAVRDALEDERTGGSTVVGTYGYMAPEQFLGDATPASDLYALGVTAVALLARKTPDTMTDVSGRLHWEAQVRVQPATRALLRELLVVEPSDRLQRASTVSQRCAAAIDQVQGAPPPEAFVEPARVAPSPLVPVAPPEPARAMTPSPNTGLASRRTIVAAIVLLVGLVAGFAFYTFLARAPAPPEPPVVSPAAAATPAPIAPTTAVRVEPVEAPPSVPAVPVVSDAPTPIAPQRERLSKSQILRVVRSRAGRVSACTAGHPNFAGTVRVRMTIAGSGEVTAAKATGRTENPAVYACVEEKVSALRFPPFQGDDMQVNMPFRM